MKKILLVVFAFLMVGINDAFSQTIKVENGASFSWMKGDNLDNKLSAYSVMFGCDYLEHNWFYLSSEIGYVKKGGKDWIHGFVEEGEDFTRVGYADMRSSLHYLQINTSFRVKHAFDKINVYIGIAPTLDFLINEDSYTQTEMNKHENDYHANKCVLGIMPEFGVFYDINKLRLSLNVSYSRNITHVAQFTKDQYLKNNTILTSIGIGYKL